MVFNQISRSLFYHLCNLIILNCNFYKLSVQAAPIVPIAARNIIFGTILCYFGRKVKIPYLSNGFWRFFSDKFYSINTLLGIYIRLAIINIVPIAKCGIKNISLPNSHARVLNGNMFPDIIHKIIVHIYTYTPHQPQ